MKKSEYSFKIHSDAILQINELIAQNKDLDNAFLRIMVDIGGCAGMKYHIILDDYISENDVKFPENSQKILVVIDKNSLVYLSGSTLEYEESLDGSSFKIVNPNASISCSCGNSFGCNPI